MDLIDLVEQELRAYRRNRRPLHLAHAARALQEACREAASQPSTQRSMQHVVSIRNRGQ